MPWWWHYACWTLNAAQIGILIYVWRMARAARRLFREAQETRDHVAKNLAESERLLDRIFGFESAPDDEPPAIH